MRFVVAYEGTRYSGWQRQPKNLTVQTVLEEALSRLEQQPVRVLGASRTDAGVHALGQVAAAETRRDLPPWRYQRALNAILPEDVRVRGCDLPDRPFLPLHGVLEKTYAYRIDRGRAADPLQRRHALHHPAALDVSAMRGALASLCGRRDFRHFAASGSSARTSVRTLRATEILEDGAILTVRLTADGFLYHMARNIVGALLAVGEGAEDPGFLARILADGSPRTGIKPAPAHGLTLLGIAYGPPDPLDSRHLP